jgi:MFS family permease
MQRRWLVLVSVSLMFFFVTGATFTSMGVVLYSMIGDMHWSQAAGGTAFSILGLSCCLSSPLPALLMRLIGTRWTLMCGAALLAAGFFCAYATHTLSVFYLGTALMGIGFSLSANIPGVYLLASWFPERAARIIGFYLMFGAFGGVVAPPAVAKIVELSGTWRTSWLVMTVLAACAGLLCLACVRDRSDQPAGSAKSARLTDQDWPLRAAFRTPQFILIAAAMVLTTACQTTVNSAAVNHLANLGNSAALAAFMLSVQALTATLAKGAAGAISEHFSIKLLLVIGLVAECCGMVILAHAGGTASDYGFALAFGLGWGTAYLAVTVLTINYFGPNTGSALLSTVWLLTGLATAGPALAGWVADRTGTYAAVFTWMGLILLPVAAGIFLMRAPRARSVAAGGAPTPLAALK